MLGAADAFSGCPHFNPLLLKARVIMREFMEVSLAPAWVRRSTDAWLVLFFAALFVVHFHPSTRN